MHCFRLSKKKYDNHLSGIGAFRYGGRWNTAGTYIVYASSSRALTMAEVYVHISHNMIPDDMVMVTIDIPDNIRIPVLETDNLPQGWNDIHDKNLVNQIGNQFVKESKYLAIYVPSAVVKDDLNLLINPNHCDFNQITIKEVLPFKIDGRMFN